MTSQTEHAPAMNNLETLGVDVGAENCLQVAPEPSQDEPSAEELHMPSNASMLAPDLEVAHNGESQCPSSVNAYESQFDPVLENDGDSSKLSKADKNGAEKTAGQGGKWQAQSEIHKDLAGESSSRVQKCWNKICCSKEPTRRIKSRVSDKVLTLCRSCAANYNSLKFCEVCEQIYPNDEAGDGFQWVLCESDTCARWNHVQCEVKRGRYDRNAEYLCSECERKTRRKRLPVIESLELGRAGKEKKQVELPQAQRAHIFDIRKDNYHYLQPFLSTYSYRLALAEDAILNDLQSIRHKSNQLGEYSKKHAEAPNKKKKR